LSTRPARPLAEIIATFDPDRVVIGLQEHLTSYDGDAVLRAPATPDGQQRQAGCQIA
jgi:hypothetical protein